ncbi:MAG: tripartite tricarboxylate transporter TctB family protein [Dethiosulfatibacter sp.]|nr:tripartite tricarboxylate transporter TctB family protein [Dethiosulfatibacter sp.]
MRNRITGLVSILISVFLIFTLREKNFETQLFPVVALSILIVLSIILVFQKEQKIFEFEKIGTIAKFFALTVVYIMVLPHLGFIISTTCFISTFIIISKYEMKKIVVILYALLVSLILWFVFSYLFGIAIPEVLF